MTSIIVITILISVLATISAAAHQEADALLLAAHSTLKASMGVRCLQLSLLWALRPETCLEWRFSGMVDNLLVQSVSGQKATQTNVALGYCVDDKGSGIVYQVEDDQKQTLSVYVYDNPTCTGTPTKSGKAPLTGQCSPDSLTSMEYSKKPGSLFSQLYTHDEPWLVRPSPYDIQQALMCVNENVYKSCSNGVETYISMTTTTAAALTEVKTDATKCITLMVFTWLLVSGSLAAQLSPTLIMWWLYFKPIAIFFV